MLAVYPVYQHNTLRNYSYLVANSQTHDCIIIDPYDADLLINAIESVFCLKPVAVVNTHDHHDHVKGNDILKKRYAIKGYIYTSDLSPVDSLQCGVLREGCFSFAQELELDVLYTPGHTMNSICLLGTGVNGSFLIAGDTLFNAGVGHCKSGGDPVTLFASIQKIKKTLPSNTIIYPGHDYFMKNLMFTLHVDPENMSAKAQLESMEGQSMVFVTLEQELTWNLFLNDRGIQTDHSLPNESLSPQTRFLKLREMRNQW